MEQHEAVKKMMLSIKLQEEIPNTFHSYLRELFKQMYVIGWEQGRLEVNQHTNKAIGQYSTDGRLVNTFKSLKEAEKRTGFSNSGIRKSMREDRPMRGWVWRYLPVTKLDPNSQFHTM